VGTRFWEQSANTEPKKVQTSSQAEIALAKSQLLRQLNKQDAEIEGLKAKEQARDKTLARHLNKIVSACELEGTMAKDKEESEKWRILEETTVISKHVDDDNFQGCSSIDCSPFNDKFEFQTVMSSRSASTLQYLTST
jgi:hypothetical protein